MKRIEIELPFAGFYESWHDEKIDDAIEQNFWDDDCNVPEDIYNKIWEADINWSAIQNEYCKEFTEQFGHHFGLDLKFIEMTSPREYNFQTDRIFASIPATQINKIRKEVESYPEWPEVIRERYTSRDGFWSHYSNDHKDDEWARPVLDECQYETVLLAWLDHRHKEDPLNEREWSDLEYELVEDIEVASFSSYNDAIDAINKVTTEAK